MTLLHIEGFDHYVDLAGMATAGYAAVSATNIGAGNICKLDTTNPATGTHAIRFTMCWDTSQTSGVRWVLPSTAQTVGVGFHLYMDALPNADNRGQFIDLRTSANATICVLGVQSDGTLVVRTASVGGTILADSGDFKMVAGGYNHVEMRVFHSATVGTIEVRIDGITRINATGVNTGANPTGQLFLGSTNGSLSGSGQPNCYVDDWFVWDTNGSVNNDFLGNRSVFLLPPDGDTAIADFLPSAASGTGFEMIDEAAPDDDTTYIYSATPTDESEFDLTAGDPSITAISGVMLIGRSTKTDSGDGSVQMTLVSGASETDGTDNPISTAYHTYSDIFETDPATGSAITLSALNAMKQRFTRTL